ncbi:hypothetical protein O181_089358 [Austropuccinia psidii MF-1]|uniref:Uncharacterized protein n=1 Tax=Austropuccinia psidii MF-1 TaxID=1389203 RepID=A0A9Q3ITC7_9BASI|nr:hypothetical protein [Austropuccinia psidii MF-1]
MCFEEVLRTIQTSNNETSFGNKINEKSAIIKELTDKYSKLNIADIIETRIKKAINTIKEENKSALENISKSFTEVKTYIIALKTCFDTSEEEISNLKMKSKPNRGKGYTAGIDLHNNKERYFTIGENKHKKFAFLTFKRHITVSKVAPVNLELERFKSEQLNEADIRLHLTDSQENELSALLYDHREAFASDKEPLGVIIGHEVDIILNIERPYPPILRRAAYPASPKSREALEINIKELLDLGLIGKFGHNEEVELTKPVIVA